VKILLVFVLVGIVMLASIVTSNNVYAALKDPTGVAVDPSDNVFTAEPRKGLIQKFTNTGTFIRQWEIGSGDDHFPARVATDSSGNVFILDNGNRILKFTNTGKFIRQWDSPRSGTEFNSLSGIATDSSDNVFASDSYGARVVKFTNTGTFIKQGNTRHFDEASDVAVDPSGNVFVTAGNIQKYTNNGTFIREWGKFGSGNGQFSGANGIAVDNSGNVFVVESTNDRVQKFTNDGKFIRKWGSEGTGKGQFDNPLDIAVDSKGYVFVADTGMDRIQKFSNTGKFIREWGHERGGNITSSSLSPSNVPMGTGALLQ
jgi:tripartite motif-containing protein 71